MRTAHALVLVTVLLAGATLLVAPAPGSPPPVTVCDPCGHTFPVETVERSTAEVRVHANGSATWTVRNWMAEEPATSRIDRLRRDPSFVDWVARQSLDRSYAFRDARFLNASMSGDDAVTMRFRTAFAVRSFAVLRVEYLRSGHHASTMADLGADRVTIVPPDGYVLASGVPGASTAGDRVVLTSFGARRAGPFLVFAPDGGLPNRVRTAAAVGTVLLPRIATHLGWILVSALLLGGAIGGAATIVDARLRPPSVADARRLAGVLVLVGGMLVARSLLATAVAAVAPQPPVALAGGVATVVLGAAVLLAPGRLTGSRQVGVVLLAVLLGTLATLVVPTAGVGGLPPVAVGAVLLGVPAGYLVRHGRGRGRWLGVAAAGLTFAAAAAWATPILAPPGQFYALWILVLVLSALGTALLSVPFLLLGALLPVPDDA